MHRGGRERGVREGEETTQERERQEGEEETWRERGERVREGKKICVGERV